LVLWGNGHVRFSRWYEREITILVGDCKNNLTNNAENPHPIEGARVLDSGKVYFWLKLFVAAHDQSRYYDFVPLNAAFQLYRVLKPGVGAVRH
jgi:hypothetical protein